MRFTRLADWLRWQETLHPRAIDLGLERVRTVAERLDLLAEAPPTVTVGGTNGKGTTVAVMESALRAGGHRTGAYTSPHLIRYNERIRIDGTEVSDARLVEAFAAVDAARGDITLTYFEFGTLAALMCFRDAGCDIWLLEVGLGGRLDAVNIVDAHVAVVTSVGIDHTDWLGTDRESIGMEKAGIFRAGRPAICGDPEPPLSMIRHAEAIGAPLVLLGRQFGFRLTAEGAEFRTPIRVVDAVPLPPVAGRPFLGNAACALCSLDLLPAVLAVGEAAARSAVAGFSLPGRFQRLAGTSPWILDVAHNPDAARSLADSLRRHGHAGRTCALFGLMRRKDLEAVVAAVADCVDVWYLLDWEDEEIWPVKDVVAAVCARGGRIAGTGAPSELLPVVAGALAPGDRVVAFGSFRVVEAVLHWHEGGRKPSPVA